MLNYETLTIMQSIFFGHKTYDDLSEDEKTIEALSALCFINAGNYLKIPPQLRTQKMFEIALTQNDGILKDIPDDEMNRQMRSYAVHHTRESIHRFNDLAVYEYLLIFELDPTIFKVLDEEIIRDIIKRGRPAFHTICISHKSQEKVDKTLCELFENREIKNETMDEIILAYPEFISVLTKKKILSTVEFERLLPLAVYANPDVVKKIDPGFYKPAPEMLTPLLIMNPKNIRILPEAWLNYTLRCYARAGDMSKVEEASNEET